MVEVRAATDRAGLRDFIHLPWRLYRGHRLWVPPLLQDMWGIVAGPDNPLLKAGPHQALVAYRDGGPAARVLCGVDAVLNRQRGSRYGYFTLFESVDDPAVAGALLGGAEEWLREQGVTAVRGPVSPTQGDEYRGVLVQGFEHPPALLENYHPPYYAGLLEACGYAREADLWGFHYTAGALPERLERVSDYAMRRYGFRTDSLRLQVLDAELRDIGQVLERAMPEDWIDMAPPSLADLNAFARRLRPLADPDLVVIARTAGGEPIGFLFGLPNYNEVLRHLNGRLFPLGWLQFLLRRRHIRGVRISVLFVVPEWRKRAVTGAMFAHALRAARRRGYTYGEGSTIGEENWPMIRDAEGAGGLHHKTFRIYIKELGAGAAGRANRA